MSPADQHILDKIIEHEGGFVDHPLDKGGPTKYGVTKLTLTFARHQPVTTDDVQNLGLEEARDILYNLYIKTPGFIQISDDELRELVVDAGVNHGVGQATKLLQRAANVRADGIFGPATYMAVNEENAAMLRRRFFAERLRLYGMIIRDNPVFATGWLNRMADQVSLL